MRDADMVVDAWGPFGSSSLETGTSQIERPDLEGSRFTEFERRFGTPGVSKPEGPYTEMCHNNWPVWDYVVSCQLLLQSGLSFIVSKSI
jgi:hypothetical protein